MIDRAESVNPAVLRLLRGHPRVALVEEGGSPGLAVRICGRTRSVTVGDPSAEVYGLVELVDNNPVVCAEVVSVPSAAATLALIALGPVASAGQIADRPVMVSNISANEEDVQAALATAGWADGVSVHFEPHELEGVGTAAVMASIWTPEREEDIAELYDERFGRSFFVRRDQDSAWDPAFVRGTPYALYRLSIARDSVQSLLTVRVLAGLDGKLGAAQIVHAMNVMCGFEESLGLA